MDAHTTGRGAIMNTSAKKKEKALRKEQKNVAIQTNRRELAQE